MEFLLFIIGIWFVWGIVKAITTSNSREGAVEYRPTVPPPALEFAVLTSLGTKTVEDFNFKVIQVKVVGRIRAPRKNFPVILIVGLMDVTDREHKPVLSAIDDLQESRTILFEFRSSSFLLPYAESVVSESMNVVDIPIDALTFPRGGSRKVQVSVMVASAAAPPEIQFGEWTNKSDSMALAFATAQQFVKVDELGYEDLKDIQRQVDELTIDLALAVASADGNFDSSEGAVVRDWLKRRIDTEAGDNQEKAVTLKKQYNERIAAAYDAAQKGELDLEAVARQLAELAPTSERYEALELCMDIAAADGTAEKSELDALREIAKFLDVDLDRFRAMQDKALPVQLHAETGDPFAILGLTDDMTSDEVRRHLTQEYRKWNGRVTHSDSAVREQAEKMLNLIAQCRQERVG